MNSSSTPGTSPTGLTSDRTDASSSRRLVGLLAALVLLGGACASSDGDAADGESSDETEESSATVEWESPISDFLGQDFDYDTDEGQQQMIDDANAAERVIAECMRAEGFEYTPVDQGQFYSFSEVDSSGIEWGTREWTETYGFGYSTQRFPQSEVGPDLVGYDDAMVMEGDEFVDPNNDYVMTLSESEQEAYYTALYGNEPDLGPDATDEEWNEAYENWEPDGCQASAWEGGFGGDENVNAFYEEFGEELDDLYQRIDADPRIVAAEQDAEACVIAAGQTWLDDEEQWQYFEEKLADVGYQWTDEDPLVAEGLDPETMTQEEIDEFYQSLNQLDDEDLEILAEVQAEEIAMAIAYDDCNAGWMGMQDVYNEVRIELEQEFLDANADRLGEFESAGD